MEEPGENPLTPAAAAQAALMLARQLGDAPDWRARAAFTHCAARAQFAADDPLVRAALTAAITEGWTNPHELFISAVSLIRLDERIAGCVQRANESWPARPACAALYGVDGLAALAADRLLQALLEAAPVPSLQLERFLTCGRHALLERAAGPAPDPADARALAFQAALARQCFLNEFVFDCTADEQLAAAACRGRLLALLDKGDAVPPLLLLAVAAYSPLHLLPGAQRLLAAPQPDPVGEVLRQQLREPLQERALRARIERLTPISDGLSRAVREQYEQNPYPRWEQVPLPGQPRPFNAELRRLLPFARFAPLADEHAPQVLVAGCGTGRDAIFVARQYRGARVLAIDLSLDSLGYAQRKTAQLGLTNIEYAQADILRLGDCPRTFDVIGAVGVLHHLADPLAGWRVLLTRLRPGGFMCLGLYSRIARRSVLAAREFIAARGYAATPEGIRAFRQEVQSADTRAEVRSLTRSLAFYSMSECRDLAFNVQERQLTLPEIEAFLGQLRLRLLGFELDPRVLGQYRARFADDPGCTSLRNWTRFEADNPDTFTAMYKFWVQRES
jgi:SAM-dependent methyltransferase